MLALFRPLLIVVLIFINTAYADTTVSDNKLSVVATFSILADMAQVIGGDYVEVYSLVGPEEDVHVYQPRPSDAQRLAKADVLILNGLGFEGWIERLVAASGYQGVIVRVSNNIPLLLSADSDYGLHGHENTSQSDPHAWQSINNARVYSDNITQAFIAVDGARKNYYLSQRDDYDLRLIELDEEIRNSFATIPHDRRKLLTSHRAYRYFEAASNIEFFAAQGINASADVSARELAKLIRLIKSENIKAAFFERSSNQRLLQQIVRDTQCYIAGSLYADSLSKQGGPASTYLEMMRYNLNTIIGALLPRL
ncbi:MAG: zinc ABC transporter substrate-binding protein [Gammaproteobacteria bacterium]|nr:zinc ABC transporter substrate-binding protein [Gammaproteobacteria bacterium]